MVGGNSEAENRLQGGGGVASRVKVFAWVGSRTDWDALGAEQVAQDNEINALSETLCIVQ